jgi:hypothetical protein
MEQNNLPEVITPQTFGVVLKTGPQVLTANINSRDKAVEAATSLLEKIKHGGMNDDLDRQANELLLKIKKTKDKIEEQRKPITQIIKEVASRFTTLESDIDQKKVGTIPFQLVEERNKYAQKKLEEQRERERQAKLKLDKDNERSTVTATIEKSLTNYMNEYLTSCKEYLQNAFNAITLENFIDTSLLIDEYSTYYSREHFDKFTTNVSVLYIGRDELPSLKFKVVTVDKFGTFSETFKIEIQSFKQNLLDLLPSRKRELEEEAERKRKADEEAERLREKIAAAKDKEEADKKQKELEELERKQKEDQDKNQQEVDARNQQSISSIYVEKGKAESKTNSEAEAKIQAEKANNLFANSGELFAVPVEEVRKVKVSYEIEILNSAAYLEIAHFYFTTEKPTNLTVDKLEKKTFAQMRAFAEKQANSEEVFITSKFLRYKEVAKTQAK